MPVKNAAALVKGENKIKTARALAVYLVEEVIKGLNPIQLVKKSVRLSEQGVSIGDRFIPDEDFKAIVIVGGGKASGEMLLAVEKLFGDRISHGTVVVPKEIVGDYRSAKVKVMGASHPIPDQSSLLATKQIIDDIQSADPNDLIIGLFSGGGSALLTSPVSSVSLESLKKMNDLLLKCGANIHEINTIRKHLSQIKGGGLARNIHPSVWISLIISDVVDDRLESIASGPTAPDPTTFVDAVKILNKYQIIDQIPKDALHYLKKGVEGHVPETLKPGRIELTNGYNLIIGNNAEASRIINHFAKRKGLNTKILTHQLTGIARDVGTKLGQTANEMNQQKQPIAPPAILIAGGETTVIVRGPGKGGRNQELALSAAQEIATTDNIVIASVATDGIDGNTDAAGAIVDGNTIIQAKQQGLDIEKVFADNDSYSLFKRLGDLVFTGFTGTNVMDIQLVIVL